MSNLNCSIQVLFLCNFFLISYSINFTFHGFNHANLNLAGATVEPSGALRLTKASNFVMGHAFYPTKIQMFNTTLNFSFSTHFVFQINPSSTRNRGGYGLAFTLSPSSQFTDAAPEHFMGVFNQYNDGNSSNHVFMVEFDTVNGFKRDSDTVGNHVGINLNGMESVADSPASFFVEGSRGKEEELSLTGDVPIQAWIDYDGLSKRVNVTVAPLEVDKPSRPLLSVILDNINDVLLENMYAGFSAATGEKSSSHYILGWSFRLNGISDRLDPSLLPAVPESSSSNSRRVRTALIATFSAVLFLVVTLLLGVAFYRRLMRFEMLEDWELDAPHRFRYRDLYRATKGFRESEKIGVGGFGAVYRGVLPSTGVEVAVKKITSNNTLQGMREFAAEIESLGRLRQKNLVHLQGWCKKRNELLLVYDYVPNGSLDSLLYSSMSTFSLTWEQRFNIIKGVASGLLYLHEEWEQVVIHRDVKSSNVLIGRDMNPRLGDFGLARLYDHGKNSHTTNVVGTIGYIAPELTRTGKVSTSTDVFAYGILLLEVVCGRKPVVHESHRNVILVDWVAEFLQMGKVFEVVDPKLNSKYVVEEMELVLGLGLLCSHPKAESRPTMRQVVKYLNGDEVVPLFERLSSAGSRRVDEVTSRLLALGLSDTTSFTASTISHKYSSSIGAVSNNSFSSGR